MTDTVSTSEQSANMNEEAVRDAERWLAIFSLFIHDLESPLASVKYLLGLLDDGRFDSNKEIHRRLVNSSRVAVERAESIIYDILAVTKAGATGLPVNMEMVRPEPVIEDAITLLEGSAVGYDVTINYRKPDETVPVEADPALLRRALDNMLYNALRHTPSGSTIDVYTEQGESSFFIHVKDSGDGLGDIEGNELFEKFGQVQLRLDGKHRGVGLGLYFCRLAAEGMGGTVMADDHPDGGAVFSIKLNKA